ncbi:MAG TPA: hypothetical protein VK186_11890 [Candidatus Deferrimicrobium sp.]|nr:hypothetical protein [Candidatus Deferrimicrobium sp.]
MLIIINKLLIVKHSFNIGSGKSFPVRDNFFSCGTTLSRCGTTFSSAGQPYPGAGQLPPVRDNFPQCGTTISRCGITYSGAMASPPQLAGDSFIFYISNHG